MPAGVLISLFSFISASLYGMADPPIALLPVSLLWVGGPLLFLDFTPDGLLWLLLLVEEHTGSPRFLADDIKINAIEV